MELGNGNTNTILGIKKSDPILVHPLTDEYPKGGYYFLSNLDQNTAVIVKTLYCYKANKDNENNNKVVLGVGEEIRKGLEKILVEYYPLAGSLTISKQGKLIVDCGKKQGVPFVEAVSEAKMEILGDISTIPDPATLDLLIHNSVVAPSNILQIPLLIVQVTKFKCGGFTIGIAINHCMADGISAMEFINSWAETTRGLPLKGIPYLDRTFLESRQPPIIRFPHQEFIDIEYISNTNLLYQNKQMKYVSFKFDHEKIERLKKLARDDGNDDGVITTSTFVVLTALVWRSRTRALKMKHNQKTKLLFAVDGRSKLNPPFPKHYFGNGIVIPSCVTSAGDLIGKPLSYAVRMIQDTIKMVVDGFIRSSIDYFESTRARPSLAASLLVTSWSRLSFNSTDFGWGEPAQTGCVTLPEKEMALFLSNGGKQLGTTVLLGLPITNMKTFQDLMQI